MIYVYIYIYILTHTKVSHSSTSILAQPEHLTKSLEKSCSYITSETSDIRVRWWEIQLQKATELQEETSIIFHTGGQVKPWPTSGMSQLLIFL